jgi:UDP-N-acetylmuramate dehydrogenase
VAARVHAHRTADVLVTARVCPLADPDGGVVTRSAAELALGYRASAVGPTHVVVGAEFALAPDDPAACAARIDEVVRWRREHQPGGANGGSVFRNPPGDAAGRLIDASGCKGLRVGGAHVSEKHANFFQADPDARADDVHRLIGVVRRRVAEVTGVTLVPELVMVGFDDGAA